MYLQTIIIFKEVLGLENLFLYSSIPFCLSNKYRGEKKKKHRSVFGFAIGYAVWAIWPKRNCMWHWNMKIWYSGGAPPCRE